MEFSAYEANNVCRYFEARFEGHDGAAEANNFFKFHTWFDVDEHLRN